MAPKTPAPKKTPQRTKQTSAPRGLQLSAAQWKAYGAAYSATSAALYRKLAIQNAASNLRQSRLSAAYKLAKITAASHAAARTAAIAAFAASQSYRQSRLAHQNAALRQRVFADFERHLLQAARLQYIYKGENAYRHNAVMRTLTSAQALSAEQARFGQAAKAAKAAIRSAAPGAAPSPQRAAQVAAVQAQARAAALAAARATPKGRTAPRTVHLRRPARARSFGDPAGYDCVAAALANHLLFKRGYRLPARQYRELAAALGEAPSLAGALELVMNRPPWAHGPQLVAAVPAQRSAGKAVVVGFQAHRGPHAACDTGHGIATWGDILPLADVMVPGTDIEETWDLLWVLPR